MMEFRTHYDNLKVARDAPDIVIRAAYRSLSQRFHPDKNPGDERAVRIMAIINRSYEVLSDPLQRAEHDAWIEHEESRQRKDSDQPRDTPIPPNWQGQGHPTRHPPPRRNPVAIALLWPLKILVRIITAAPQLAFFGLLFGGFALYDAMTPSRPPPPGPKPYSAVPSPETDGPAYKRPSTAPNGQPWPARSDYIAGYPTLASKGHSEVTVDNRQNDSDVFVKLVSLSGSQAFPARQFYIPAHSQFTLKDVSAGTYDIRYRDLKTGGLSRSEGFQLDESETFDGIEYSTITMTLYKVQGGNLQTYGLSELEF